MTIPSDCGYERRSVIRARAKLHIGTLDPDVLATIEALLVAVEEEVRPPELAKSCELSRQDLGAMRDRLALAIWNGTLKPGQLSLRWLHRESRWQTPADRSADEFVQVHQGIALLNMLDFLIAGLGAHDRVEINPITRASDG